MRTGERASFFYRLGWWAAQHQRGIVTAWGLALVVGLLLAPRAGSVLQPGGFSNPNTEGSRGLRLLRQELGLSLSNLTLVFHSAELQAGDPAYRAAVARTLAPLAGHPRVERVVSPFDAGAARLVAPDGRTSYALVGLNATTADAQRLVPELKALLPPPEGALQVLVTGGPAAYADIELVSHRDLERAERVSLPLALLVLVLIFRSVVAAALPVLVGGISVLVTLSLVFLMGRVTELSIFVQNIATMLGLGVSIDYALLLVSRFREERAADPAAPPAELVARTSATAGRAVFFSGVTVFLGLCGLLLFDYMMLRSIGMGGALVVAVAVLGSLTLLPALLVLLGPRLDRWRVPLPRLGVGGLWHGLAAAVVRRPLAVFLGVLVVLLLLGSPFLRVRLGAPDVTILPPDVESRRGFDLLREAFGPGRIAPVLVVVEAPGSILERAPVGALYDYTRRLAHLPGVAGIESIVDLDPAVTRQQYQFLYANPGAISDPAVRASLDLLAGGRVALVTLITDHNPATEEARALVRAVRAVDPGPGLRSYTGGAAAELMDVVADLYNVFPRALLLILVTTYLALLVQFQTPVLPAKAVVMDALSILASYGALVLVFQDGHLHGLLGFRPEGVVDATVPIVMFCVLFGLSMDYEVFMLSRMREEFDRHGDNALAVSRGLTHTGGVITSAALIIVIVAGSFAFTDIIVIKALGIGMALAILMDATVVRVLLVPAAMHLLGRWNWWTPGRNGSSHIS